MIRGRQKTLYYSTSRASVNVQMCVSEAPQSKPHDSWVLFFFFFLKDIVLNSAFSICQIQNESSMFQSATYFFMSAESCFCCCCLNRCPKFPISKTLKEKKRKSAWKLFTNSFPDVKRKGQKRSQFLKLRINFNKNAPFFLFLSYLCLSRCYLFTIQLQFFLLVLRAPWPGCLLSRVDTQPSLESNSKTYSARSVPFNDRLIPPLIPPPPPHKQEILPLKEQFAVVVPVVKVHSRQGIQLTICSI